MLCAPTTVIMAGDMGARIIDEIGDEGKFYYPKLDLIATAMLMGNINDLKLVNEVERPQVLELRNKLVFEHKYIGKRGVGVDVSYDLEIK